MEEFGRVGNSFWKRCTIWKTSGKVLLHEFGRVWESWEFWIAFGRDSEMFVFGRVRANIEKSDILKGQSLEEFGKKKSTILEEIWPEITIWKTSVMILEEFYRFRQRLGE